MLYVIGPTYLRPITSLHNRAIPGTMNQKWKLEEGRRKKKEKKKTPKDGVYWKWMWMARGRGGKRGFSLGYMPLRLPYAGQTPA